jgi:hypothetical protein
MLLTYPPQAAEEADKMKTAFAATYKITNLSTVRQFLRIVIYRNKDCTISLGPTRFIDSVLKRFYMERAYNATTPLDDKVKLNLISETEKESDPREIQAIVGSLM